MQYFRKTHQVSLFSCERILWKIFLIHVLSRQEILSDEEAQEITRLLQPNETKPAKWQPDASSSFVQDSASCQDSLGPPSLNDSMGPPSLQDDSITDPIEHASASRAEDSANATNQIMQESVSSIDISTHETTSKLDTSVSDSGLIGIHINFNQKRFQKRLSI